MPSLSSASLKLSKDTVPPTPTAVERIWTRLHSLADADAGGAACAPEPTPFLGAWLIPTGYITLWAPWQPGTAPLSFSLRMGPGGLSVSAAIYRR